MRRTGKEKIDAKREPGFFSKGFFRRKKSFRRQKTKKVKAISIMGFVALIAAMIVMPAAAFEPGECDITVCASGCDYSSIRAAVASATDGQTVCVYNGTYSDAGYSITFDKPNVTLRGEGADVVSWDGGGPSGGGIIIGNVADAPGCVVEGLTIKNSPRGLEVTATYNNQDCIIRNCVFEGPTNEIFISASNTTFMNNIVTGSSTLGSLYVGETGSSCIIDNNTLINIPFSTTTKSAIVIKGKNCTVSNNTIANNTGRGIVLSSTSVNNTITKNNISSNYLGFKVFAAEGHEIYLNNICNNTAGSVEYGTTLPATIYWNSTEPIDYTYGGTTYTNYLGNYWSDYTGSNTDGDGIGDTDYDTLPTNPNPVYNDTRPLMEPFENYFGAPAAEPPHLVTYTISNRTITPPQTTEIDVEFSEYVKAWIKIEDSSRNLVNELYYSSNVKNPTPKIWNGTYANGTQVPDGNYYVNVTGTNTTTGLSVVNNTEVITVLTITEQPDLLVTAINAYHNNTGCPAWFNLSNEIDVTVKNNGTTAAGASNVSLYIEDVFFGKLPVSSLPSGANATMMFKDWKPIGDDCLLPVCEFNWSYKDYNLTGVADCDNDVAESNETNNETSVVDRVCYNGYMADEPLENVAHGTLHGQLIYTTGNGTYGGLYSVGASKATGYDITLPSGASVELAHLNVYYTWHYEKESCPQMEVSITNATGTYVLPLEKAYNDIKCTCPGAAWVFPWGNYVYDLTDYITGSGTYTVTVKRTGGPSFCIAAPGIALVYEDANAPQIEYWINEGADVLIGGRRSDGGYLAWWECINNATFQASTETGTVTNATLGVVAPWGDSVPDDILFFNDIELGRGVYNGYSSLYSKTIDSISLHVGSTNAQVGVNVTNVTGLYLNDSENMVGQADDGDNMMPSNAFLVVEYEEELPPPEYTIKIADYTLALYDGGEVIVPVEIQNASDIAGGSANITFNASVVNVKAVSAGHFGTPAANIDNTAGFVHVAAGRAFAVGREEAVLANLLFEGISEGYTALNVQNALLNFEDGNTTTPAAINGSITVETWMLGDLNHNNMIDTGDATLVLRMVVGLVPTNMLGDMNHNGMIDTGDATLILRRVVGLPV